MFECRFGGILDRLRWVTEAPVSIVVEIADATPISDWQQLGAGKRRAVLAQKPIGAPASRPRRICSGEAFRCFPRGEHDCRHHAGRSTGGGRDHEMTSCIFFGCRECAGQTNPIARLLSYFSSLARAQTVAAFEDSSTGQVTRCVFADSPDLTVRASPARNGRGTC